VGYSKNFYLSFVTCCLPVDSEGAIE